MIWAPFALALALGLVIAASLYFAYQWPQIRPTEPSAAPPPTPESTEPASTPETT